MSDCMHLLPPGQCATCTAPAPTRRVVRWREHRRLVARWTTVCPVCDFDIAAGSDAVFLVDDVTDDTRTVHTGCLPGPNTTRRWCGACWQPIRAARDTYNSRTGRFGPAGPDTCPRGCR